MQGLDAHLETVENAGTKVLDQHVRTAHEVEQNLAVGVGLEVERH